MVGQILTVCFKSACFFKAALALSLLDNTLTAEYSMRAPNTNTVQVNIHTSRALI